LIEELAISSQTIVLLLDIWTSSNNISFLAIIGYWLTKDFEYKEVVLEFTEIEGHKSRENMARIILDLLCELDIESKLISITSDTTSNNKTLVEEVETGLHDQFEEEPTLGTLCFYRQSSYI